MTGETQTAGRCAEVMTMLAGCAAARWIARDALRELTSTTVAARLRD